VEQGAGNISTISALLAALTAVLGGAVILSGRRRPAHVAFVALNTNVFLWHLFSFYRGSEGMRIVALGTLALVPVTLLGFLRTWLRDGVGASVLPPRGVPRTAALLLVLIELGLVYAWTQRDQPQALWAHRIPTLVRFLLLLGLYAALSPLWQVHQATVSRVDKRRLLYLIFVGLLTITVTAWDHLPVPLGRGGPALGTSLTVVYLYFLQQTLFLDRLLDINELLGKVVVLSAFVLILSAIHMLLTLIGVEQRQVVTVVAFVILLLYDPLRRFLEGQVHRFTARDPLDLTQQLSELRQTLTNVIDPREAVRLVLSVFEETRRFTHASVYLLDQDGAGYELAGHLGPRPADRLDAAARRPLLHRLLSTRQPVTLDQLEREHDIVTARRGAAAEIETMDAIARSLVELNAGAVIGILAGRPVDAQRRSSTASGAMPRVVDDTALVPGETILGLLCIRDERSRDAFASAEHDVLAGIAAQLGITLQNSKLYERMKERDRLAALGQMAAGLAHEIRNPLGAIKGAAEFVAPLPDGTIPDDAGDFLRIIVDEAKRLNRVVSQFLDYARPFRGDMQLLDVNDVARKIEVLLRPLLDEQVSAHEGALVPEVILDLAPDLPRTRGDAEQLRQVFLNLALNAVQAMLDAPPGAQGERERGVLTIATGLRHGGRLGSPMQHIEVRFQDTGPGIAPAAMKNLFIPFFTTKERGTGLGLPISQRIIENHGGFIEARSRPGSGATFTVVLPVSEN
jgi:signal transduction histidine kinase